MAILGQLVSVLPFLGVLALVIGGMMVIAIKITTSIIRDRDKSAKVHNMLKEIGVKNLDVKFLNSLSIEGLAKFLVIIKALKDAPGQGGGNALQAEMDKLNQAINMSQTVQGLKTQ
jgi:hypothetical protein